MTADIDSVYGGTYFLLSLILSVVLRFLVIAFVSRVFTWWKRGLKCMNIGLTSEDAKSAISLHYFIRCLCPCENHNLRKSAV